MRACYVSGVVLRAEADVNHGGIVGVAALLQFGKVDLFDGGRLRIRKVALQGFERGKGYHVVVSDANQVAHGFFNVALVDEQHNWGRFVFDERANHRVERLVHRRIERPRNVRLHEGGAVDARIYDE